MSIARLRAKALGLLRVVALLAVLLGGLGLFAARQARAAWGERLAGFGVELKRWGGLRLSSAPRRLFLNGAQLELVSASSALSVAEVLDRLERTCSSSGGVIGAARAEELLLARAEAGPRLKPWLRDETAERGVVACLDTGGALSVTALTERLSKFAKSGDLADVGGLRYALAERHEDKTSVLFLWTDGALPLKQMFPPTGDAPGRDPLGIPRPSGGVRMLSAAEEGTSYGFTAYRRSELSAAAALAAYRTALAPAGFMVTDLGHETLMARQGDRALLLHAGTTRSGVAVSVSELR